MKEITKDDSTEKRWNPMYGTTELVPSEFFRCSDYEGVDELKDRVKRLEEQIERGLIHQSKVIFVEEVSLKEAKNRVYNYLKSHKSGAKTTEMADKLHLNLEVVLKSLTDLNKEGKIEKTCRRD